MLFNIMCSEPARLFPLPNVLPSRRTAHSLGYQAVTGLLTRWTSLEAARLLCQGDLSGHKPGQASMIAKSNWAESGQAVSNPVWAPVLEFIQDLISVDFINVRCLWNLHLPGCWIPFLHAPDLGSSLLRGWSCRCPCRATSFLQQDADGTVAAIATFLRRRQTHQACHQACLLLVCSRPSCR